MRILLSAGHTNYPNADRGMVSGSGHVEGVEAVKIRDAVSARLRERGLKVIEDGPDGVNNPLKEAVALARTADVAVEFHFNSGPPKATGIEVLSKAKRKALAQKIAGAINAELGIVLRGDKGWKSDKSGHHSRLAFCEAGGLICEVAFITNADDMTAYVENFAAMTIGIANAIDGGESETIEPEFYTVQKGDTLTKIFKIFKTSVPKLKELNGLTSDKIVPGQRLRIR